jgi:hypothetical protein
MSLPVGPWRTFDTIRGIEYRRKMQILGMCIGRSTKQSVIDTCNQVTRQVKTHVKNAYHRDLCLAQRIQFVHTCLLAKIWYVAQLFPAPKTIIQQLNAAVIYFIWKGSMFRVPLSMLHAGKMEGGWDLVNVEAQCRALFLYRMHVQGTRSGLATAASMTLE